jgi:hypothetical protein
LSAGRALAERLQQVTTRRSGLGLLFLIKGGQAEDERLVVSRFPADQGVIAEEQGSGLSVEFVERVFLKSAHAYKSVMYVAETLDHGFWQGVAVDRQASRMRELSNYWIGDFLDSELLTTGPAGTKRLATAIRKAVQQSDELAVRQELVAATQLLRNRQGHRFSARQIIAELGVSQAGLEAIEAVIPRPELMDEIFQFDRQEFDRHVLYRSVQLDNGGLLTAEQERFADVFQEELLNASEGTRRYVTEGRIVDERIRKTL